MDSSCFLSASKIAALSSPRRQRDTVTVTASVLHLLPLADHRASTDGPITSPTLSEGFVHCSGDVSTTLAVANAFFRHVTEPMVAVELDVEALTSDVRWEPPDPAAPPGAADDVLFPHVYGPLNREAVIDVHYARRDVSGRFLDLERRGPIAEEFDLLPHPEGGWYRRTWASEMDLTVPGREGVRPAATAILFLLPAGKSSEWHMVASDELWFFHRGGPLTIEKGGPSAQPAQKPERVVLGRNHAPQALVPARTWQRAEASEDSLVSCVASPGFDFADFRTLHH
jgi:predicted cupin superfamily sugar epimerase/uncharacterized protein (DUF952 family)